MGLFRQEVLEARKVSKLGSISILPPTVGWIFFSFATAVLFALVVVGVFGSYSRVESVSGRLVPAAGQSRIIAPGIPAGVITDVLVREGQRVRQGQPLLKIADQRASSSLGDTGKIVSDQIAYKLAELKRSMEAQTQLAHLRTVELRGRVSLLSQRINSLDDQIASQDERYESSKALYQTWREKAAEVISGYQISQQYDTVLQQKTQSDALREQRLQVRAELSQVQAELDQLPVTTRDRLSSLSVQIADVQSEKAENEQSRERVLRAPTHGVIANLLAHAGQSVSGSVSLMSVLPEDARLVVELWVPSRSIGLLRVGEPVSISYEAFPAERYGWQRGKILAISKSAVSATELESFLGNEELESAYRVVVDAPASTLPNALSPALLKPGMALAAKISVENRRVIDWLLRPRQQSANVGGRDSRREHG